MTKATSMLSDARENPANSAIRMGVILKEMRPFNPSSMSEDAVDLDKPRPRFFQV